MILENHDWSITDYTLSRQEFNKELVDSIKQVFDRRILIKIVP